ncbi:autophagy-related protein 22-like protein [Schizophyllum amplum]|uniref:Autophagy-related protein n=1 Tax=Schizophyllum amplum TaxID=97359 RepID=A0A550BRS5_9AGAR|nr:autophagy-related protein 22-like protein [Auriculariopsis ampla]
MSDEIKEGEETKAEAQVADAVTIDGSEETKWTTSRWELWSYYVFYIGNSGLAGFNYGPSQFQNLLFLAGYDPSAAPGELPCGDGACVLRFAGKVRDINSIVLVTNGISFALQAVLLLIIGAWADYGTWRPNITIFFTIVAVAVSFAWLGVERADQWEAATALYVLGLITYQCVLTFWTAAFPGLARDLPEVKQSLADVKNGDRTLQEHAQLTSLSRNRISNLSFTVCSVGEIVVLAIMVGIVKGLKADESTESNTKAFSVLIAFAGGIWLLCAIPWFLIEKRRPGLQMPAGTNLLTVGFKQIRVAFRECLRLNRHSCTSSSTF